MGSIEAGRLYCLIVQARRLDSELKAEKLPCDMFSHDS